MATVIFPEIGIDGFSFYLDKNHDYKPSPFTNRGKTRVKDGDRWVATLTFRNLDAGETALLESFIWSLNGTVNSFYMPDYRYKTLPVPSAKPKVKLASQTGVALSTKGWPASQTVLQKGSYIEVSGQMRGVIANVVSNASGDAVIKLSHRLYKAPPIDAVVNYWAPRALMQLKDNNQGKRVTSNAVLSNIKLDLVEDIL